MNALLAFLSEYKAEAAALVLLGLFAGYFLVRFIRHRHRCTMEVEAELTGYTPKAPGLGHAIRYYPVFRYEAGGKTVEAEGTVGSGTMLYQQGQKMTIRIDPDHPEKLLAPKDAEMILLPPVLAALVMAGFLIWGALRK